MEAALIGVDSHKDTLCAAAVSAVGKPLSALEVPNDDHGHDLVLVWADGLEGEPSWAIEGSATFGRVFAGRLVREGRPVMESPAHLTPRQRKRSRRPDKSDRDDAIAIARSALAEDKPLPAPRPDDRTAVLQILVLSRMGYLDILSLMARKILVSMDERLIAGVDEAARAAGMSRSAFLSGIASDALGLEPGPGASAEAQRALEELDRLFVEAPAGSDATEAIRAARDQR